MSESLGDVRQYIAFAGIIGAGKSYMSEKLSERLGIPMYEEPQLGTSDLEEFYNFLPIMDHVLSEGYTPEEYKSIFEKRDRLINFLETTSNGTIFQFLLLAQRTRQIQRIQSEYGGAICDRTLYEDRVFAKILNNEHKMSDYGFKTYCLLSETIYNMTKTPDLVVFLDVSPEEALKRIKMRNRGCESGIEINYLKKLHTEYKKFIPWLSKRVKILRVSYDNFISEEEMIEHIVNALETGNIIDV